MLKRDFNFLLLTVLLVYLIVLPLPTKYKVGKNNVQKNKGKEVAGIKIWQVLELENNKYVAAAQKPERFKHTVIPQFAIIPVFQSFASNVFPQTPWNITVVLSVTL